MNAPCPDASLWDTFRYRRSAEELYAEARKGRRASRPGGAAVRDPGSRDPDGNGVDDGDTDGECEQRDAGADSRGGVWSVESVLRAEHAAVSGASARHDPR